MKKQPKQEQELIDGQWRAGMWNGFQTLTCVYCQWDTLEGIEAARAHQAQCPRCSGKAQSSESESRSEVNNGH